MPSSASTTLRDAWRSPERIALLVAACVLAAFAISVAGRLAAALGHDVLWSSDLAIYLIDADNATHLSQRLGTSSRFGWAHPGPLNYYLLTPFYLAGGAVGLMLGTFVLNMMCTLAAAWLVARMSDAQTALMFVLATMSSFVACFGLGALLNPLIPHATILVFVLATVLACAVVRFGFRWAPVWVVALCFVTQAHVAYWLPSGFLALVAVVLAIVNGQRQWRFLAASAVLAVVLWLPPLLEWHNLVLIFRFFAAADTPPHAVSEAFRAYRVFVGEGAAGASPLFGGPTDDAFAWIGAVTLLLAGAGVAVAARRLPISWILGSVVLTVVVVELFSLTRFTGPILPHSVLFMMATAPLCGVLIFVGFVRSGSRRVTAALALATFAWTATAWSRSESPVATALQSHPGVAPLSAQLHALLAKRHDVPAIDIEQDGEVWPIAIGALSEAYRQGDSFAISPPWAIVFGGHVKISKDIAIRFVRGPDGPRIVVLSEPAR